jgi:hypothetical protein
VFVYVYVPSMSLSRSSARSGFVSGFPPVVSPLSELSPVLNRGTFYQLIIYCGLNEREIFAFFCAMPCGGHVSSSCGEPRRIRTS